MTVARLDGVSRRYRDVTALDAVSFTLAENTIYGLLGRNGAGKTTAMQILTGQAPAGSGRVEVFGVPPYENPALSGRLCFVKESQRYSDQFQVRHTLRAASMTFPRWDAGLAAHWSTSSGCRRGGGSGGCPGACSPRSGSSSGWPPGPN